MITQSTIRALTKLEFAYGLATRMAELIGDESPATTEMLGELACYVRLTANAWSCRSSRLGARARRHVVPNGASPSSRCGDARRLDAEGRRDHHADRQPQPADDAEPRASSTTLTLRPLIDEMLHGADGATADERAARVPHGLGLRRARRSGGRGFLYERFYLTSATRNEQLLHRGFDRTRANAIVDEMLAMASQPPKRER